MYSVSGRDRFSGGGAGGRGRRSGAGAGGAGGRYLLADGGQAVEAVAGRFEAHHALARAAEAGVAHAYRRPPRGRQLVLAGAARGGGAPRGERAPGAGGAAPSGASGGVRSHAAAAPAPSPEAAVLGGLEVLASSTARSNADADSTPLSPCFA
ncbi:hypothetical protein EVAR_31667_1 [Eumeta japonica]|uniref:Uncharacterized protein n=1 Tax=Eumeta variegata TaxID=151549 RepID=A0A4C1VVH5_EUMVA|nr:hypothetical protein EVAR_31667_1 [Eumeta japonica]